MVGTYLEIFRQFSVNKAACNCHYIKAQKHIYFSLISHRQIYDVVLSLAEKYQQSWHVYDYSSTLLLYFLLKINNYDWCMPVAYQCSWNWIGLISHRCASILRSIDRTCGKLIECFITTVALCCTPLFNKMVMSHTDKRVYWVSCA